MSASRSAKVLVTRPSNDGQALCCALKNLGIQALHQPLIEITKGHDFPHLATKIAQADIVISVSQHAIYWAAHSLSAASQDWPQKISYFAIGKKTATCLAAKLDLNSIQGQKIHVPLIADSENLLKMRELAQVKGKKILILRGDSGRELIAQELTKRGALVEYACAYQRRLHPLTADNFQHWQQQKITHLVVTSGEQLMHLVHSTPQGTMTWLQNLYLFIPSQRIAKIASELGFLNIIDTGSAANPVLCAHISKHLS